MFLQQIEAAAAGLYEVPAGGVGKDPQALPGLDLKEKGTGIAAAILAAESGMLFIWILL